jgi:quercetin dioxygenase-like cupin family protein
MHEQVVNVIEGQFELTVEGKTTILNPGDLFVIPSNAGHTGRALTKCKVIDVFYPIREDYR